MEWFNAFGLIFMAVIMVPNVIFAIRQKGGFENKWSCKPVEIAEQIGRIGCFVFMVINIPGTWFGWRSEKAFAAYLRTCSHRVCARIFEQNLFCSRKKSAGILYVFQGFLTRNRTNFAEKTCAYPMRTSSYCRCGADTALLWDMGGLLSEKRYFQSAGAFDNPVGDIFVQRDHEPFRIAYCFLGDIRALPHYYFL